MNIAVIGTSKKRNEKRVAIHPSHIGLIKKNIRKHLFFEKGYGEPFGVKDEIIRNLTGNRLLERQQLLSGFQTLMIPKPVAEDFEQVHEGTLIWGWIHCVEQTGIAQTAIKRHLTLLSWEHMYSKDSRGPIHIFNRNNEMAGYCSVQNALQLTGIDGNFGPSRQIAVLGFGSAARGAISALIGHGFNDITVYTQRPPRLVSNRIPYVKYEQILSDGSGEFNVVDFYGETSPLLSKLYGSDVIVNCVLQNPNKPHIFLRDENVEGFIRPCLIIDVSCDHKMGFEFAHSTTFEKPIEKIGNILYYSVDHTPTLLWNSASWEISTAILPYLPYVVEGKKSTVLENAIDIKNGIVLNKEIFSFQHRSPVYPYQQRISPKKLNFAKAKVS